MQSMTTANRIFIRCAMDWSYRYIGGIKDFIPIDFKVMETYYQLACYYVRYRHNFITGHLSSGHYSQALAELQPTTQGNEMLWQYVLWEAETLYRQLRPFLDHHRVPIEQVHFLNDDRGEILGFVIHLRTTAQLETI